MSEPESRPNPESSVQSSGTEASDPSDEHRALAQAMFAQGLAFMEQWLPGGKFASPEIEEQATAMLMAEFEVQVDLQRVFDDMIDPVAREKHPWIGFYLSRVVEDGSTARFLHTRVPKKHLGGMPAEATGPVWRHLAALIGLMMFPPLRAMMRAYGWEVNFEQASTPLKPPPEAPKILT